MCNMTKKGYILIKLGQLQDETLPKQDVNLKFWNKKILQVIQKEHCVWVPHTISV